jgi:predicted 3-demethylubiquinone-9 3-methyltransferase (glyoxalase superfamily)
MDSKVSSTASSATSASDKRVFQTCLWFDDQAEEAVDFYCKTFTNAKKGTVIKYGKNAAEMSHQPENSVMCIDFTLENAHFLALNGGKYFKINPSISFVVRCSSEQEIMHLWKELNHLARMELEKTFFAEKYGWCEDKYGVNWQLFYGESDGSEPKINPALTFGGKGAGKVEEAMKFYAEHFPNSKVGDIMKDDKTNSVMWANFTLDGNFFNASDGRSSFAFEFCPAISFIIPCENQKQVDDIFANISAVPEAEVCGWLQDKYGVSWQVVSKNWSSNMSAADDATRDQLMATIRDMKKPDLEKLDAVFRASTSKRAKMVSTEKSA